MDSTDFTTALTRAQQAGIGKDEFLKIWDMEAQLRLVREQAKRCGQQENKLQKSMGFTERNINNAIEGNHSTFENSTQEIRMSPDLLKGREKSEDLTKNLPCPGKDAAINVNTDVSLQTYKLKEDFDQVRKELAEEMRQLKEEMKSLKDNILSEKCQENGHEKFCSEIREQKQELAGLREDVRQWRKEFVELKEILFTMNGKLEQADQAKKTRASLTAASSCKDVTAVTANDIVSDSTVTDDNQTCRSDDGREENKDCSHAKPENTGKQDNVSEEAQSPNLNNHMNDDQSGLSRLQKGQQLPQPQNSREHQQQQLKHTLLHKLQQKQSQQHQQQQQQQQPKQPQQQQQQQQPKQPDAQKNNKEVGKKPVLIPQTGVFSKYFAAVKDHSLNGDIPYLPKNGAILEVTDIDQAVAGKEPMTFSPFYRLPNSSTTVRLWIRFTSIKKLNVQLLIFDLKEQSARDNICFTVSGELKDFTSQGYNWFFHGSKGIEQYFGPYVNVHASVCLRTSKGLYDNVSIGVLKQKERYILDNSLFIRWFVKSEKLP